MKLKRVAVIGPAGSGRSFLINSLLGSKHVEHAVRASPVTIEISCHRDVVEVNGMRAVLELVDTPGFCGQGVIIEQVKRDLKTKFKHIDKVVIVIAKDGLEVTEKNEIRSVLQFLDYKNNPQKLMILINDRREKGLITQQQKDNDLSNVLHMLGVEDYTIMKPNTHMLPIHMSLSNDEEGIFHSEIEMIQEFLLKETATQDPIIQSDGMTNRKAFSVQSMTLPVLAAALLFGFLLNSYMHISILEEEVVSQKAQIEQLETNQTELKEKADFDIKRIETMKKDQTKLKDEAESNKGIISTLEEEVVSQKALFEQLETNQTKLKEKADFDLKRLKTLEKDQTKLKEEAESNKGIISTLEEEAVSQTARIEQLENKSKKTQIQIQNLQKKLIFIRSTDQTQLKEEAESNKGIISTLEEENVSQKAQIEQMETNQRKLKYCFRFW